MTAALASVLAYVAALAVTLGGWCMSSTETPSRRRLAAIAARGDTPGALQ